MYRAAREPHLKLPYLTYSSFSTPLMLSRHGSSSRLVRAAWEPFRHSRALSLRRGTPCLYGTRACADSSVSRLYRGIIPPLMLEAPKRAIKCECRYDPIYRSTRSPQSLQTDGGVRSSPTTGRRRTLKLSLSLPDALLARLSLSSSLPSSWSKFACRTRAARLRVPSMS